MYQLPLRFSSAVIADYELMTGRLRASFKNAARDIAPIFTLDSDINPSFFTRTLLDSSSDAPGYLHLQMNIADTQTLLMTSAEVIFDIAHVQTSGARIFSGIWKWPVSASITRMT